MCRIPENIVNIITMLYGATGSNVFLFEDEIQKSGIEVRHDEKSGMAKELLWMNKLSYDDMEAGSGPTVEGSTKMKLI